MFEKVKRVIINYLHWNSKTIWESALWWSELSHWLSHMHAIWIPAEVSALSFQFSSDSVPGKWPEVLRSLASMWKTRWGFQAPGFWLALIWPLRSTEDWTSDEGALSVSPLLLSLLLFQINKSLDIHTYMQVNWT